MLVLSSTLCFTLSTSLVATLPEVSRRASSFVERVRNLPPAWCLDASSDYLQTFFQQRPTWSHLASKRVRHHRLIFVRHCILPSSCPREKNIWTNIYIYIYIHIHMCKYIYICIYTCIYALLCFASFALLCFCSFSFMFVSV